MDRPVRLEKQEDIDVFAFLNQDIIIKVKFYFLFFIALIMFVVICFLMKPQTYGFFNA